MMKGLLFLMFAFLVPIFSEPTNALNDFNDCAAVFVNQSAIIKSYSKNATSRIDKNAKGNLEIYTVEISEESIRPLKKIKFKVAIKDSETGTLWLFSDQIQTSIEVDQVLAKCQKGDEIVLMTIDRKFALPHNEIVVK